ncbi:uncharacterized protein isoform X2 [Rhodnius prolixus]|uniref:uncharacterized protein isoform X2 n=1 Tax=Rhodnius prolixus TaxID=13249 RepID=UPI003D18DA2B
MLLQQLVTCLIIGVIVVAKQTPPLPMVDPGLFVISGVTTCGAGSGYCLLGIDCSLDQDFIEDASGHCEGLKGAFTPSAHFVCCRGSRQENEIESDKNEKHEQNNTLENDVDLMTEEETNSTLVEKLTETTTEEVQETTSPSVQIVTSDLPKEGIFTDDGEETSSNPTTSTPTCAISNCSTGIRFFSEDSQICLGTFLGSGWVLTSASCALRIFRIGMVNVYGSPIDDPEFAAGIKTIIVNENYRPSVTNILLPEPNNVGLIMLNETLSDKCIPCLPNANDAFAGEMCHTFVKTSSFTKKSGIVDLKTCEGEVETMQGEAKEDFLTISCDSTSQARYLGGDVDSGKALLCQDFIAGVETSSGIGMIVFTKVAFYSEWIKQNMKPNARQYFKSYEYR